MSLGTPLDLRGLNPAPVTPFTSDGDVDYAALADLGKCLASDRRGGSRWSCSGTPVRAPS